MLTFKQFLSEKKMSAGSYAATMNRLQDSARIGFEVEVFVPADTFFHQSPDDVAPETHDTYALQTLAEFEDLFDMSKPQRTAIQNDFTTWQVDKEDQWVEENWDNYMDSSIEDEWGVKEAEKEARKYAIKKAKNQFTWHKWFTDQFTDVQHFTETYELQPKYGWSATNGHINKSEPSSAGFFNGWKKTASAMAEHLGQVLKQRVTVNGNADGKYRNWNLVFDDSIKNGEDVDYESEKFNGYGVEIVSPPLPPTEALTQLEAVFNVLSQFDIQTNESTGIHVNISLPKMDSFDPLKLVLFMGDRHILQKFDRMTNTFTKSQYQRVVDSVNATGMIPTSVPELIKLGQEGLAETGKYFSVNLKHLPKYLEFRAAGGKDYHTRLKDIREVTGRWLSAVEIAADPSSNRREYLKKLAKIFDESSSAEDLAKREQTFSDILFRDSYDVKNFEDVLSQGDPTTVKRHVLNQFYQLGLKNLPKQDPTFAQLKDARAFMKRTGASVADVLDLAKTREQAQTALSAFKRFKLA